MTRSYRLHDLQRNFLAARCRIISSVTELLELLPPTSATLMLMPCFSSTWLYVCGVGHCLDGSFIGRHQDRQPPRAVVSYVAPVSYRTRAVRVPIMIPVPVYYPRYWYVTINPRANNIPRRSYRSHPGKHVRKILIIKNPPRQTCVKDLDHTDPIGEIWSRSRRSYRSLSANICRPCRSYISPPGKHVRKIYIRLPPRQTCL